MLVPGFAARALPVDLPNLNAVRYRSDGKLVALSFSGKVFVLADTDGDGLEDQATVFYDPGRSHLSLNLALTPPGYPLGSGVFIARKGEVVLELDTDGDDRADKEIVVASNWVVPERYPGGASDAVGVAVDATGQVFFGLEAANSQNGYLLNKEKTAAGYRLSSERGTILKVSPDFSRREVIATGIRCSFGLALNAAGDLFATEQEGATWMPNGNPFDELLHIQPGRHYGFPPRHPKYLPGVIDEPSAFDYGPQHQSTCGLFFNEPVNGGPVFGPDWWRGDAFVAGESRGKIYRTKLIKTAAGYVAQTQIIAAMGWLTIDQCVSPRGDLVVSAHSGPPDWGTGATGRGRLFKLTRADLAAPQPVFAHAASPTELRVTFDRPLADAALVDLARRITLTAGLYIREGDRFESFRPGYRAVNEQQAAPRETVPVLGATVSPDRRTLLIRTPERRAALTTAIDISGWPRARERLPDELPQASVVSIAADQTGAVATWVARDGGQTWSGWLPHLDLDVARGLTTASAEHARLWELVQQPGTLTLRAQLDLWNMLRPALQPGSRLDHTFPAERVNVAFTSGQAPRVSAPGRTSPTASESSAATTRLLLLPSREHHWLPVEVSVPTGGTAPTALHVDWSTAEDARPRAFALRRVLVPWATPAADAIKPAPPPELAGGDWNKGKLLFAMCAMCHGLNSEGSRVGPDLSNLVDRDYASVLKDIVEPNATINPNHVAYSLKLRSGEVLVAVLLEDNASTVLLATPGGAPRSLPKSDIAEMTVSPVSLMPAGLDQALGPQGLKDLLTFLMLPPPAAEPSR
ncbi:MAG: c-type cytochrome [Opitutaceae bacterium]|nr:c-type cytochrome [Opitutaceae bacterium]